MKPQADLCIEKIRFVGEKQNKRTKKIQEMLRLEILGLESFVGTEKQAIIFNIYISFLKKKLIYSQSLFQLGIVAPGNPTPVLHRALRCVHFAAD